MGVRATIAAYRRALGGLRSPRLPDAARLLARRPGIAFGVGAYETGLMLSGKAPGTVKALAVIKTSALIGCPF